MCPRRRVRDASPEPAGSPARGAGHTPGQLPVVLEILECHLVTLVAVPGATGSPPASCPAGEGFPQCLGSFCPTGHAVCAEQRYFSRPKPPSASGAPREAQERHSPHLPVGGPWLWLPQRGHLLPVCPEAGSPRARAGRASWAGGGTTNIQRSGPASCHLQTRTSCASRVSQGRLRRPLSCPQWR